MKQASVPLTACAAAVCLLAGCSASRPWALRARPAPAMAERSAPSMRLAAAALPDGQLGAVRGGFDVGSGAELRFAFQQATYVDRNLVQTVVLPTVTLDGSVTNAGFVPSSATTAIATPTPLPPPDAGLPSNGNTAVTVMNAGATSRPVLGAPFGVGSQPSFSWLNFNTGSNQTGAVTPPDAALGSAGSISIVSALNGNGISSIIGNTVNGQLVQQVTRVDISTTGLSTLLQAVRSPLLDNLRNQSTLPR